MDYSDLICFWLGFGLCYWMHGRRDYLKAKLAKLLNKE